MKFVARFAILLDENMSKLKGEDVEKANGIKSLAEMGLGYRNRYGKNS